jgi:hypothetical protein
VGGPVKALAAGTLHVLWCLTDGQFAGAGNNTNGELSVPRGLDEINFMASGRTSYFAATAAGPVVAWGAAQFPGTVLVDLPTDLTNPKAIALTNNFGVAIKADGDLRWWGLQSVPVLPAGFGPVRNISANFNAVVVVNQSGALVQYPASGGVIGPVPPGLGAVRAVDGGYRAFAAARANGTCVVWGGTSALDMQPPAGLGGLLTVACGDYHALGLRRDGSVAAWGSNGYGQTDLPSDLPPVEAIEAVESGTYALLRDGTLRFWGATGPGNAPPAGFNASLSAWGRAATFWRCPTGDFPKGSSEDCNGNGVDDACEVRFGFFDCNGNGIPDACDIANGFEVDADGDGRLDSCDNDCNANAINDAVEIANGAADTDHDGRIDDCERAAGDGNLNGVIGPEDLTMLLGAWGTNGVPFGDLDLSGTVAASDLAIILANWGSQL